MTTKIEVQEYVRSLDSDELKRIFAILESYYVEDTLSDEFQIWAELTKVFRKYTEQRKGNFDFGMVQS